MHTQPEPLDQVLRRQALRLLALREHSRAELQQKLLRVCRAYEAPQAEQNSCRHVDAVQTARSAQPAASALLAQVLQELEDQGLLNEARFAHSLVQSKSARFGRQRLEQELRRKGIDEHTAQQALTSTEQDDAERAWQLWQKRFGDSLEVEATRADVQNPSKAQAKQMRFLQGRGFSSDVIRSVIRRAYGPASK